MDCSCWKEKTGNALRLGVQAGPEQNEWNQGSNQTFGHCVWLPLGEHRALCSSAAVDIFFWHVAPCWPLFACLIVVRKACFGLGFVLL